MTRRRVRPARPLEQRLGEDPRPVRAAGVQVHGDGADALGGIGPGHLPDDALLQPGGAREALRGRAGTLERRDGEHQPLAGVSPRSRAASAWTRPRTPCSVRRS